MKRNIWTPKKPGPDQSFLLQRLPEDVVFGQDITQQEVILLLLCGNKNQERASARFLLGSDA